MRRELLDTWPYLLLTAAGLTLYARLAYRWYQRHLKPNCKKCQGTGRVVDPLCRIVYCETCNGEGKVL